MKLQCLYEYPPEGAPAPRAGQNYCYLLVPDGNVPQTGSWAAFYVECAYALPITGTDPNTGNDLTSLPGLLQEVSGFVMSNPGTSNLGFLRILFFSQGLANTAAGIVTLGEALRAIPCSWDLSTTSYVAQILWTADPTAVSAAVLDASIQLLTYPGGSTPLDLATPESCPIFRLGNGTNLFLCRSQPGPPPLNPSNFTYSIALKADGGNEGLLLYAHDEYAYAAAYLATGCSAPDYIETPAGTLMPKNIVVHLYSTPLFIGICAGTAGQWQFRGAFDEAVSSLGQSTSASMGLGFQYAALLANTAPPNGYQASNLTYPLLNDPSGLKTQGVFGRLSPLAPADPGQTNFYFHASSNWYLQISAFDTAFRTTFGKVVELTPISDTSQLVFNTALGGQVYLTPNGPYSISTKGGIGAGQPASQLLCGLSGVEGITFAEGDTLTFTAGQPATLTAAVTPGLPPPEDVSFQLPTGASLAGPYTTAWAMLLPGNATTPSTRSYYSESDRAPFFAVQDESYPNEPSYYPVSGAVLPNTAGPATMFPIVPYQTMVSAAAGFGANSKYVAAIEFQALNPTRAAQIKAMATAPASTRGLGDIYAVTPQGYQATFSAAGAWTALEIAQMSAGTVTDVTIEFAPAAGETALTEAVQDAFLTNQQFLVITKADNLGTFTATIEMDGWPFTLDFSKNKTVGDYRNVLIFKSCNASLGQMSKNPALWTRRPDFAHVDGDPEGIFLSNWLVNYLEQAKALYDHGNGIASLAKFCALIDNPDWNGFLVLKVDVSTQALPPELAVLMARIDPSLFYAHHIGNELNRVAPLATAGQAYQLTGSPFGLVHYLDPRLGAEARHSPSYISTPQDYHFEVLVLEAVFEKAVLTHFSSTSLLMLNKLFGDTVQHCGPNGAPGANTLVLLGSYHAVDGVPSYSFATAKGATVDFYPLSGAFARNRISRANMTVVTLSQGTATTPPTYLARFGLWGDFKFLADSAFDLLSFHYLPYQGLALEMMVTPGSPPTYVFDSNALVLSQNPIEAVAPGGGTGMPDPATSLVRTGSLLSQFPLRLKSFVTGTTSRLPAAMGFRRLRTDIPRGVSLPSPSLPSQNQSLSVSVSVSESLLSLLLPFPVPSPAPTLPPGPWYALAFDLNLGSPGSLASGALSAEFMLAWAPGGAGTAAASPQFKLAGPGGVSLSFDLEGILKFGAKEIVLNNLPPTGGATDGRFVLIFESIAVTALGLSFPPAGTTNVILRGGAAAVAGGPVHPTLEWFGGYSAKPAGTI